MNHWFGQRSTFAAARKRMVREQLSEFPTEIRAVMERVPRHEFVPGDKQSLACADMALPIGYGQTISQPYIVALMTTQLEPQPADRVLEIGTGSGYQAAVLAELVAEVFSVEIIGPLAERAAATLRRLGCQNVHLRIGDGSAGWAEAAPFDGITVACAPEFVPAPLTAQLKDGGRMLIPVGPPGDQDLFVFQKRGGRLVEQARLPVRFVPMTGRAEHPGLFT
jgi:protein-L-isoaspartate(D-aspartate) O-methyltransferase